MAAKDNLSEHLRVVVLLLTAVLASVDHGLCMLLIDDEQIPVDQRYRITTKAGYRTDLTAGTEPYLFATDFWSQQRSATRLMFGRWASADTAGFYVGGVPSTDIAGFQALEDTAGFRIAVVGIAAGAATPVIGMDFELCENIDDVLEEINSILHTVGTAAYANYDAQIDSLGRIFISDPADVGADSKQVTISAPATGVDMTLATYLNFVGGSWVDGLDAETPLEALNAVSEKNNEWFCLCERGCADNDRVTLAANVQTMNKIAVFWEDTYANCNNIDSTTQAFARIHNLGYGKSILIYDPGTLCNCPDAVIVGAYISAVEGKVDWANWQLAGATSSNLGSTVKGVLDAQKIIYFETNGGITYNPYGMSANGNEIRWVVGAAWLLDAIQGALFSAKIAAEAWGFDIPTFGTIDSIARLYCGEAVTRGFCVNTVARPMVIDVPDPDSFDQATRASHTANLGRIAQVPLNSAIYDMDIEIALAL